MRDLGAFCKIRQSAGFIAGKDCDSRERGRPARTRPGREVAIGLTDLVGSPYDRHRAAALQECGRDARAPGGEPTASQVQIHPEPADHDRCPPIVMPDCEFCKRLLGVVDPEKTTQAGERLLLAEQESAVPAPLSGPAPVVDHAVGNKGVVARGLPDLHVPLTDVA